MSLPKPIRVECQSCRREFDATVWGTINTRHSPELREAFLAGKLNVVTCPRDGWSTVAPVPVLYHDADRQLMIWIYDARYSGDPSLQVNPELTKATDRLGSETISVGNPQYAREAIRGMGDSGLFTRTKSANPDCPDSKVHAEVFRQHYHAAERASCSKDTILVVNAEPIIADRTCEILGMNGYNPRACYSSTEAIEQAAELHPAVVVIDSTMEGASVGVQAAMAIQRHQGCAVLLCSGLSDSEVAEHLQPAWKQGFDFEVLPYPLIPTLLTKLTQYVPVRESADSTEKQSERVVCQECGSGMDADWKFCPECGAEAETADASYALSGSADKPTITLEDLDRVFGRQAAGDDDVLPALPDTEEKIEQSRKRYIPSPTPIEAEVDKILSFQQTRSLEEQVRAQKESAEQKFGWHWLWFVPLCVLVLLVVERHTILHALRLGGLALRRWSWGALFSPSAYFCWSVVLTSVLLPIRGLWIIAILVTADSTQVSSKRYLYVVLLTLGILLLPFLTDALTWGSFPFPIDNAGIYRLRLIPFFPWPDGHFGEY